MSFRHDEEKGRPIKIRDEGVPLTSNVSEIDFTGAGVTGTVIGNSVTEDIPGGAGSDTLQSVTDRGATTTNDITANSFIGDGSQLTNLPIPDLTDYWKNDGSSTATGNWDLGDNNLTVGGTSLFEDDVTIEGDLEIIKISPELKLTDEVTGHNTRLVKIEEDNFACRYNQVLSGVVYPFATGGDVSTYTDSEGLTWRVHTFDEVGADELIVETGGEMEYLVVAGGGGGGKFGGGGGAGGMLTGTTNISIGTQTIEVGDGGAGTDVGGAVGDNGENSVFGAITATGGGGGAGRGSGGAGVNGANGGSGGGGSASDTSVRGIGGSGIAGQGRNGGSSNSSTGSLRWGSGGGGGAGAVGADGTGTSSTASGGKGGDGLESDITGTPTYYAGGGGGATFSGATSGTAGSGGLGGGGNGTKVDAANGGDGLDNTGGGGGGGGIIGKGGKGGSGIVIIRYNAPEDPESNGAVLEEIPVWCSKDSDDEGEVGIQTFGHSEGRTVIQGNSIRFNIENDEVGHFDNEGNLAIQEELTVEGKTFLNDDVEVDGNITGSNLSGTNTGDQSSSDFNLSDLGDVDDTDKAEGKILKVDSEGNHVYADESGGGGAAWGEITGTLSDQTDLQTALDGKEPTITEGTTSEYYRGDKTFQTLDKDAVGLGNVDNTSDATKNSATATLTNKTITDTTNNITANGLRTATGTVSVSSATAPTAGQVLTATNGTTATWQDASGGGGWTLVNSWTHSTNVATVTLTNLGGYDDLMVFMENVNLTSDGQVNMTVSEDNGSTFLTTNKYTSREGTFTLNNISICRQTSVVRSGFALIHFCTRNMQKAVVSTGQLDSQQNQVIDSTAAIDALKFETTFSRDFTQGKIYVFGR
jgi:hypothetical protein